MMMEPTIYRLGVGREQFAVWCEPMDPERPTGATLVCQASYQSASVHRVAYPSPFTAAHALRDVQESYGLRGYREVPRGEEMTDTALPCRGPSHRFAMLEMD